MGHSWDIAHSECNAWQPSSAASARNASSATARRCGCVVTSPLAHVRRKCDAEAWAKAAETDLSRGAYVPTSTDRRRTVAELIDATIRDHPRPPPHEAPQQVRRQGQVHLRWWRDEIGELTLERFTPQRIAEARARLTSRKSKRGARLSPASVNRYDRVPSRGVAGGRRDVFGRRCSVNAPRLAR